MESKKKRVKETNVELRPIRVERIKQLMKEEGLNQKEFGIILGGAVPIDARNISKMLSNGKITADMCTKIKKAFPKYELEWLLGNSNYKTVSEKNIAVLTQTKNESNTMLSALVGLAKLSGFKVEVNPSAFGGNVESVFNAVRGNYITFSREGKKVSLSVTDLKRLENKLCDYVEFELIHMCE